jgi:hypothetical protein
MSIANITETRSELNRLIARFRDAQRRCSPKAKPKDRPHYQHVTFDFPSARAAAEYMLAAYGPIPPGHSIDRRNPFQGYAPGNLRYLDAKGQRRNQRCEVE